MRTFSLEVYTLTYRKMGTFLQEVQRYSGTYCYLQLFEKCHCHTGF